MNVKNATKYTWSVIRRSILYIFYEITLCSTATLDWAAIPRCTDRVVSHNCVVGWIILIYTCTHYHTRYFLAASHFSTPTSLPAISTVVSFRAIRTTKKITADVNHKITNITCMFSQKENKFKTLCSNLNRLCICYLYYAVFATHDLSHNPSLFIFLYIRIFNISSCCDIRR